MKIIESNIKMSNSWRTNRTQSVTLGTGLRAPLALLVLGLALLAIAGIANATILAYEPFNYSVGPINSGDATTATGTPTATTGGGFTGNWFAGGSGTTIVGGLTYAGLQTANNALQWSTSVPYQGENLATAILPVAVGTVYVSFLYNAPSYTANKTGFAVDNGAGQNKGYYMGMTASGTFGVATIDNGSGTVLGTAAGTIGFNTTYFIVVKFVKDSGGAYYQSGSIYINPTPGGSEPAASGTFTGTYTDMNKIADFLTALGGSTVICDEIRIGTTWADVTPPSGVTPPAMPTGLQVTSTGANSVSLSWTASTGSPTSYNIKRATTSGGTYTTVGTTTAPTVTFTDTVTGGTTYYYEVSAVNAGGESANSSFVSATPTLGVPGAPTGLAATPGNNQVALTWTAPAIGSPTSYKVLRGTVSGTYTATNTTASTSYTDATAVNGTPYYYVVQAVNTSGTGAKSAEVSATPAAVVIVYEPFNYTTAINNGDPTTASGFTGNWTVNGTASIVAGLTYPGLPTANSALSQNGGRDQVSLTTPLSSGTKFISFLFNQPADNGANYNGIFLPGSGATSLFAGYVFAGTATGGTYGLASVTTSSTSGTSGTTLAQYGAPGVTPVNYNTNHLIVMEIDFNTSGANDTVSLWIDPPAGTNSPGVPANLTTSAYDVGTVSGIGFNLQGGGVDKFDEVRVGNTYGQVVGSSAGATVSTTLALSITSGKEVSWSAVSTNYYQVQSSPDNSTWSNVGSQLTGSAVTSVYDPAAAAYYQVLQDTPTITEEVQNGGFETPDGSGGALNWQSLGTQPPTYDTTDTPNSGTACMSLFATNDVGITAQTSDLQQNVANQGGAAIIPGNTYNLSFWAKALPKNPSGGNIQQYNIFWLDSDGGVVAQKGFVGITANTSTWTQTSTGPLVAPSDPSVVSASIEFYVANGGIANDYGGVLIDDVSLSTTSPSGSPTVIPSTVQAGAVFTATVQTNGVTATAATGTVAFQINSVAQSTGTVAGGTANSAPAIVPASYTVTAIYSGDVTYLGSTNTLVVGGSNFGPGKGTVSLSGGKSTVVMSGVAGNKYSMERATNVTFTAGISNFPTATAPTGGNVTNVDNFSDLGAVPKAAFYRLQFVP